MRLPCRAGWDMPWHDEAGDHSACDIGADESPGKAILTHLTLENRPLGEIECLRGAQDLRGTTTV